MTQVQSAVMCIKDKDKNISAQNSNIKEEESILMRYLMENKKMLQANKRHNTPFDENKEFMQRIQKPEVDGGLQKMKLKNIVGLYGIPIEVWRFQ